MLKPGSKPVPKMKKILALFLAAAASAFGIAVNDVKISQATSASPPAYVDRFVTPVANSLLGFNSSVRPADITLGANLSLVGNVLSATSSGGSVNWGSIGGVLSNQADLVAALAGKQSSLTFSTGLTNSAGTVTVNPAQVITRLSNLTTNGFVKTSSANGTLIIDTSTYLTANQTITLSGDASGSGGTSIAVTVTKINGTSLGGLATGILKNTTTTGVPSIAAAATDYVAPGATTTSGLTMSTARLLGRTTASTGAIQEITVGSGLTLSGGSLTATGGSGSVTTVSVVTANGVSGSVANATTTPAITLTLGAITPSTVNGLTLAAQSTGFTIAGGTSSRTLTLSGNATLSGTNTGDQTNITGNAGTATALQTARAINGVDFDGTIPITIGVDAANLTGTTIANTVVTSSLTTVGVIGTGAWQGSVVTGTYGGTGVNNGSSLITIGGSVTFSGAFTTTFTITGNTSLTLPSSGTLLTTTAANVLVPTLRNASAASYLTVTMPADTAITATTESIGVNFTAGTRQWATGSVALQREHVFGANTITAVAATTFTTAINVDIADPIQGTNATLTNLYGLRANIVQFTKSLTLGLASSATGLLKIAGTTSGVVTVTTADAAGFWTLKLPSTAGTNLWFLQTDGSGNTTWAASTGGVALGDSPTWTGIHTWTPTARSSGTAPYFLVNIPTDTGITASSESIGWRIATGTRTWATTGTVGLQREVFFGGPTYASAGASQTFTDAFTVGMSPPIAGSNAIFTRGHTLAVIDSTSAASSITGGLIVAATVGTSATSVGIGGGNINAGGTITAGGAISGTTFNGNTFTTGSYTLTGTAAKTLTFQNTITLAGTDATVMTFPAASATVAGLGTTQIFTGTSTFAPTARSSGVAAYWSTTTPTDTGITASTESIGWRIITGTRTWATTGTVGLQREVFFGGPTYASAGASQTFTDAFTVGMSPPIQGTNAIFTRNHTLALIDATSAVSSITGGLIVAATVGTSATSVGIGGGNVNAGGSVVAAQLGVGASPTARIPVVISPAATTSAGSSIGIFAQPTLTAAANSDTLSGMQNTSIFATTSGGLTGLLAFSYVINTPTVTGTSGLNTSYQLYIAAGATATTHWGIYQAGSDDNFLTGKITAASYTSGAPSGGTAGVWKLGILVTTATVFDSTRYIQVDVGGVAYKICVAQ